MQVSKNGGRKTLWLLLFLLALTAVCAYIARGYVLGDHKVSSSGLHQPSLLEKTKANVSADNQLVNDASPLVEQNLVPVEPIAKLQGQGLVQVKQAYFLTQLAQDRLRYAHDIPTARQLLQSAQEQLQDLNNSELTSLKAQLTQDQNKLNSLQYPDMDQLQNKFDALDKLVASLSEKQINVTPAQTKNSSNKTQSESAPMEPGIKGYMQNILSYLKSMIRVRKQADPDLGVAAFNVQISKAQLKLQIEQMRWSAFYSDADLYQKSIKRAQDTLSLVFAPHNASTQQFAQELSELSKVNVQPEVPSIKDTLNTFHKLLIG